MLNKISRKSQGLSINVVIMAAIGLAILVLIIIMISGKVNIFNRSVTGSCQDQLGICLYQTPGRESCSDIDEKPIMVIASGCQDKNKEASKQGPCCVPLK